MTRSKQTRYARRRARGSGFNQNIINSSGHVYVRFSDTTNLRKLLLSPLAINTSATEQALGYHSPRLARLADTFFEYRFKRIKFKFARTDSNTADTVAVGFQNAVGTVADPSSIQEVMDCSWAHLVGDEPTRPPIRMSVPSKYLHPPLTNWLKATTAADDNFELQGVFYFWCTGSSTYDNTVEVDYEIEFRNPIYLAATPAGEQAYAKFRTDPDPVLVVHQADEEKSERSYVLPKGNTKAPSSATRRS